VLCLILSTCWGEEGVSGGEQSTTAQLVQCRKVLKPLREGASLLEKKLRVAEDALEVEKQETKRLREKLTLDANELEDLRKRTRKAEDEFMDKETSVAKLQSRIRALKRNNTQLVELGRKLRMSSKQAAKELDDALALLEYEKGEAEGAKQAHKEAEEKAQSLEEQMHALESTEVQKLNAELSKSVEEVKARNSDLKHELQKSEGKREQLEEDLEMKGKELDSMRETFDSKTKKLEQVQQEDEKLSEELERAQGKLQELENEVQDKSERVQLLQAQLDSISEEKKSAEGKVSELSEKQAAAERESEKLKKLFEQYKTKVDDPALVDYFIAKAEWLQNPKVEGVDQAYQKTMKVLEPTQIALLEMQALLQASTEKLGVAVSDEEYSPLVSGLLTYGILFIPLALSLCLLVRLKRCISLTKLTMLCCMYNALFSASMFAIATFIFNGEEPMAMFRKQNEEAFEFLQIVFPLYYGVYLLLSAIIGLKAAMVNFKCKCSLRAPLHLIIPLGIMVHYYQHVWVQAMFDKEPAIATEDWAAYACGFLVHFVLLTCCAPKNKPSSSKDSDTDADSMSLPLLAPKGGEKPRHGHRVEQLRVEKEESDAMIDVNADFLDPEDIAKSISGFAESMGGGNKKKSKKKKKRKETFEDTKRD